MKSLKITYYVDTEDMTQEQYEDQEDTVYEIPLKRLLQLIEDELPNGRYLVEVLDIELI